MMFKQLLQPKPFGGSGSTGSAYVFLYFGRGEFQTTE